MVREVTQGLHEGLVGHAQVLVATPGQHGGPLSVSGFRELGGQPGLAHPRLAGENGDSLPGRSRLLPELGEALELRLATHEDPPDVSEQRRHGNVRRQKRFPCDLAGRDRRRQTLQLQGPYRHELVTAG